MTWLSGAPVFAITATTKPPWRGMSSKPAPASAARTADPYAVRAARSSTGNGSSHDGPVWVVISRRYRQVSVQSTILTFNGSGGAGHPQDTSQPARNPTPAGHTTSRIRVRGRPASAGELPGLD